MLGKKRRSELEQIRRNAAGEYVYVGAWYEYCGKVPRKRALARLWLLFGLSALGLLGAGLLPLPSMTGCWYALLPYVAWAVAAASLLWTLGRLTLAGDPIREYVYETARFSLRGLITALCAGLTLLGQCAYLLLHGPGGYGGLTAAFLILTGLSCACTLLGRRAASRLDWRKRE